MDIVEADDQRHGHSYFHGDEREFVLFDARPKREEMPGACREQERNARAQGDDDDVIETPCGVAEECSNGR